MPNQTELKTLRCDKCHLACCGEGHGKEAIPEPCDHEGEECPCGGTMREVPNLQAMTHGEYPSPQLAAQHPGLIEEYERQSAGRSKPPLNYFSRRERTRRDIEKIDRSMRVVDRVLERGADGAA